MMKRLLLLSLFFLLGLHSSLAQQNKVPDDPKQFHLFLLAGQSNMAGRGKVTAEDKRVSNGVLTLNRNGQWVDAVDPIHFDKPGITGVGLGKTFAKNYAEAHPGVTVGLIPCAVGGSPIAAWEPGGFHPSTKTHPYDEATKRTRHARRDGTLKGILWHQGESDCKPDLAMVYEQKLHRLIARFRTEFQNPNLPFIAGQMGQFRERPWNGDKNRVDSAHQSLPRKVRWTVFVNSDGLSHKGDKIHFNSDSYRELGKRYFAGFSKLEAATQQSSSQ